MKTLTHNIRTTVICLVTATAIALPGIGHASAIDTIQNKVTDISKKLNSVYGQMRNSSPLISVLKDGKLINDLKEIMLYLKQSRADYDQFANSGIYEFTRDMTTLLDGFGDIASTMKLDGISDRLDKSHDLIGSLPPQFMYIMHKAIGPTIIELRDEIQSLNEQLSIVADLPSNREMLTNPERYTDTLCPLVNSSPLDNNKNAKVVYTLIMARLNLLSIKLDYANDMIPDDLTVMVNVVGGGGTNFPFPAKPISRTLMLIKDSVIQRLVNAKEIASVVCE